MKFVWGVEGDGMGTMGRSAGVGTIVRLWCGAGYLVGCIRGRQRGWVAAIHLRWARGWNTMVILGVDWLWGEVVGECMAVKDEEWRGCETTARIMSSRLGLELWK